MNQLSIYNKYKHKAIPNILWPKLYEKIFANIVYAHHSFKPIFSIKQGFLNNSIFMRDEVD